MSLNKQPLIFTNRDINDARKPGRNSLDSHCPYLRLSTSSSQCFKAFTTPTIEFPKNQEILLFIHGYNNSETDCIQDTQLLQHAVIESPGNPLVIAFDWASNSADANWYEIVKQDFTLVQRYASDSEVAIESVKGLYWLILHLLDNNNNLHLLCHSMGSKLLVLVLRQIGHEYALLKIENQKTPNELFQKYFIRITRIQSIMFKEADLPEDWAVDFLCYDIPRMIESNPKLRCHIFSSDKDKVLDKSETWIHGGVPRLGQLKCAKRVVINVCKKLSLQRPDGEWNVCLFDLSHMHTYMGVGHNYFSDVRFGLYIRDAIENTHVIPPAPNNGCKL